MGLIEQCSYYVSPTTVAAIVRYESGGKTNIVGLGSSRKPVYVSSAEELKELAESTLADDGIRVDIGMMQINYQWIQRGRISYEQALDPCSNIRFGTMLLHDSYVSALALGMSNSDALVAALSEYNTGRKEVTNSYPSLVVFGKRPPNKQVQNAAYEVGDSTEFLLENGATLEEAKAEAKE